MNISKQNDIFRPTLPILLVLGISVRVIVWFQNRSLFLDESNLARNIAEHTFSGLFAPLDLQHAPPLFLVLEKINYLLMGATEWSLRFWPLVMACIAFYLFYQLTHKFSNQSIPLFLVLYLFTFSAVYIRYASEVKQYSTDMAVSTFLLWAVFRWPVLERQYSLRWILIGSLAIWLSMPSVFVLAGVGCYFLFQQFEDRRPHNWGTILLIGSIWLLQFGIYYYLILGSDLQTQGLTSYHQTHFWPLWPNEIAEWERLGDLSAGLLTTLIGHTVIAQILGVLSLFLGIFFLWKSERDKLLLLLLPPVLCLLASGLGLYSLMERLTLFMMPLLGLLFLIGVNGLWVKLSSSGKIALVIAFIPVLPLRKGWSYFLYPYQYEEMRPLLQSLNAKIHTGDLIWVDHNASPAFRWYTFYDRQDLSWEQDTTITYSAWDKLAAQEIIPLQGDTTTYWLIFSHLVSDFNRAEMEQDLHAMQQVYGKPLEEVRFSGVAAWKYLVVD